MGEQQAIDPGSWRVRPAGVGDLDGLKALAELTGGGFTNLPNDRDALATVTKRSFAKAYAEQFGGSEDDAIKVINDAKDSYRLSIEGFADRVKEYLDSQPPGFRLNFFVDEAGQFIGQERSRLLNLQTVVESLATATDGRARCSSPPRPTWRESSAR